MIRSLLAAAALAAAGTAQAAPPVALMAAGSSFVEYAGAAPVGNNGVNSNDTLYWVYESSGTYMGQAVDSWFLFFDPRFGHVQGTVTFDSDIVAVFDDQAELIASAGFGKPGLTYDYSNRFVGLEGPNKANTSFSDDSISLFWRASNPGDHIRVLTVSAVPEPETYALMLAGLGVVGLLAHRRKSA